MFLYYMNRFKPRLNISKSLMYISLIIQIKLYNRIQFSYQEELFVIALSFRFNKKRLFYICAILFFLLTLSFFLFNGKGKSTYPAPTSKNQSESISTDDKIAFLSKFGWEVDPNPIEIFELIIPFEFNDTYTNYNDMQKQQGFDLSKYKGKCCKRFVYSIKNYPNSNKVRANILTFDGKIIGGDISSVEINGFMHGFSK